MWRRPTEADLVSSLSWEEVEAFRQDGTFDGDPVEDQIRDIAEFVRGFIRANGSVSLCPDEATLPASLVGPAMDYLRYRLLTRMNLSVNDSRTKAWEAAKDMFQRIADGGFSPESYATDPDAEGGDRPATRPGTGRPNPDKRLLD